MVDIKQANELVEKYIKNENLRKHCYGVSSAMRSYASKYAPEDVERWEVLGLLHDLDWEAYPDEHPLMAPKLLEENGIKEEWLNRGILSHYAQKTLVKPESLMEKCLLACDEVVGIITATSLMRPNGISDLKFKSVKKKLKDKSFAKGVDRELIYEAFEDFNELLPASIEFSKHVENVIEAMREDARLGL